MNTWQIKNENKIMQSDDVFEYMRNNLVLCIHEQGVPSRHAKTQGKSTAALQSYVVS